MYSLECEGFFFFAELNKFLALISSTSVLIVWKHNHSFALFAEYVI